MYVSSFCGYLHHFIWHEEWLPYRWCGIASRFSLRDTGSSLLDDTAYAKHFFLWLIVFALSILLYFSFCKAYRLFVKFLNVWFLSLHFCMSAFAYNLTLCMVLVSSSITKVFTLCPLFSILLRIFTAIDGSIDFELPSQFFLQSYFFFRFVELSTLTYSACLCHYVIAYHLSSFASNHWSVTWKNVDKPFFYSLSHVCHSVYYFTSVIISCSMHVFKVKIDLFHRALSHFGVLQI